MGLVDPFSAASKPMPDWDSIPSRPLPFAATLHALDLNAPLTSRLPRPVRRDYEELPQIFPSPPYSNARQGNQSTSISSGVEPEFSPSRTLPRGRPGSDEWMESMVANCVDNAKCDLNLSGFGLESVSSNIRDLRDLVTLSTKSPSQNSGSGSPWASRSSLAATPEQQPSQLLRLGERSFTRTQSAPASAAFFSRMNGISEPGFDSSRGSLHPVPDMRQGLPVPQNSSTSRRFTRSKTGAMSLTRTQPNIGVFLSQNRLTTLPTALFEIRNLTVLSLRNNQLLSLPAAIGDLVHLRELNISNNLIECLPSTILGLDSLEQFWHDPNPWLKAPAVEGEEVDHTGRVLGPLRSFQEGPVQRLSSLCLTVLLSPRPPANLPPFMSYDWDAHRIGGKHPLLDIEGLQREILPEIAVEELRGIVQAVQSGCNSGTGQRRASTRATVIDRFPASHKVPPPDDASTNMYYNPCPSPRHQEWDEDSGEQPLARRVFLHPAEERIEWREVAGVKGLPIRWLGCSPGCLGFLEEKEEDWPVDGFGDEPAW